MPALPNVSSKRKPTLQPRWPVVKGLCRPSLIETCNSVRRSRSKALPMVYGGKRPPLSVGPTASLHAAILRWRVASSMAGAKRRSSAERAAKAWGSGWSPAGFEFSWRAFQDATHNLWLARNDCKVGARGGVRLEAALFPLTQCTHRNMVARGEFLLRKAERASY